MELQTPWSSLLAHEPNLCDFHEHTVLIRHVYQDAKGEKSTFNQLHTSLCICALIYIYDMYTHTHTYTTYIYTYTYIHIHIYIYIYTYTYTYIHIYIYIYTYIHIQQSLASKLSNRKCHSMCCSDLIPFQGSSNSTKAGLNPPWLLWQRISIWKALTVVIWETRKGFNFDHIYIYTYIYIYTPMKSLVLNECCGIWSYLHLIHHPFMAKPRHMRSRCRCNTANSEAPGRWFEHAFNGFKKQDVLNNINIRNCHSQLFGILLRGLYPLVN